MLLVSKRPAIHQRGFTLIELGVVVFIIAILLVVLIPAVSGARSRAKLVAGTAQVNAIAQAIDTFYTEFQQLPGPLPLITSTGSDSLLGIAGNTYSKFSDSQNLLLGLSRRIYTSADPNALPTPITGTQMYYTLNPSIRPVDVPPFGASTNKPYDAFINPTAADLSPPPPAGFPNIPCFVDSKVSSDQVLPILYFRAAQKYDISTGGSTVLPGPNAPIATATFYANSNTALAGWSSTLPSITDSKLQTFLTANLTTNLQNDLFNSFAGGVTQKGNYVLISPGLDRIYGADSTGKNDDIVISGGL